MQLRSLSATGIRDFLQCNLKIVFRYNRDIVRMTNDHAKVGIAVHEALEQFTRRMLLKQSFPDPSDYEFAVTTFMNSATEEGLENMGFYSDGRIMVTEFVNKFDPSEKVVDVEHRFKLETPEGIPIVGAIDKVVEINDNTIAIIDYKTARQALTPYELKDDVQLSMYDLAASIVWPQYENRLLFLDYVRIDKKVSTYRTDEDRIAFRDFLKSIWIQIDKMQESEAKGKINRLCGWCDYKEYCHEYTSFMDTSDFAMPMLTNMSSEEFLEHWSKVSAGKSVLEARQRELKMMASEKSHQGDEFRAEGRELYSTQAARTNYNVEDVLSLIPKEDLYTILNVNKTKLDRYSKDDPELKNKLSRIAKISYNAPVFKIRDVKEDYADSEQDTTPIKSIRVS